LNYSRAYLHHTIRIGEIIGSMLLTWHNLHYYQELMSDIRKAIKNNEFSKFVDEFHKLRSIGDMEII
jgi:queuine tRNA-ribosyltransferase